MKAGSPFRRVFRLPGRRGRVRAEIDEELAFHVEMRIRDLRASGLDEEEANAEALRQFGDVEEVRRACRRIGIRREGEMRIADGFDRLRQDVRFALRQFVKAPLVTGLAVLTLAVGIGAGTIVFTVVDAVVLAAVPLPEAEDLYALEEVTPRLDRFSVSEPNFLDWRSRQRSFVDIGAYTSGGRTLTTPEGAERIDGLRVSSSLLELLGVELLLGRHFREGEDLVGAGGSVVVLSEGFWRTRYGGDEAVIGTSLTLDGMPFEVVGVVAADRAFPGLALYTPLRLDYASDRGNHGLEVAGRLAPEVTEDRAREELAAMAAQLSNEHPVNAGWGADLRPLRETLIGESTIEVGTFLLGAVGLLLLMACGSVSNLLIARATARRLEIGLRAALGAGRRRIIRQLVTESAVLGFAGALGGVVVAWLGVPIVRALGPGDLERLAVASIDARVLAFAAAASILCVLVFGVAPALFVARGGFAGSLRERSPTGGGRRIRDGLVAAQFALAIVVVLGAGLMVRSFEQVQRVDLGFEPEGALRFDLSLPAGQFSDEERSIFLDRLTRGVEALPGVQAAGLTMTAPFGAFRAANAVAPADNMPDRQEDFFPVSWRAVEGEYFPAAGIELVAGRAFGPQDAWPGEADDGWQPSVVIDVSLARLMWGRIDVIGEEIVWGDPEGSVRRVVGVAESAHDEEVGPQPRPRIYLQYDLFPWPEPSMIVRGGAGVVSLMPTIRSLVTELDPRVPVTRAMPVAETLRNAIAWPRFTMQVLAAFGLVAIVLAAMGIYGVTAFNVERRRKELGIRVALGADPSRVLGVVLRGATRVAAVGIVVGLVGAWLAGRFIESLLFQTGVYDPLTWLSVPLGLAIVALAATWLPARRATRVDPREALAAE